MAPITFRTDEDSVLHSPESDAEFRDMQAALGAAISAWGGVEGGLSLIFQRAVGQVEAPPHQPRSPQS